MSWTAASTFLLRQAGFPFDLLEAALIPGTLKERAGVDEAEEAVHAAADRLRDELRTMEDRLLAQQIGSCVGQHQPLPERLLAKLGPPGRDYQAAHHVARAAMAEFTTAYEALLDAQRERVLAAFRDDTRLREVLLLSNDDQFELFQSWLDSPSGQGWTHRTRRRADLFALYLQRVAAKNETNSHFGPFSVGRFADGADLSWSDRARERRHAYFSHWAAEEIGRTLARRPGLRPYLRPRRNPLALLDDDHVVIYEATTDTGLVADWTFGQSAPRPLTEVERWLLRHSDGQTSLSRLHQAWPGQAADLDGALDVLSAERLLFAHFEIPVGDPEPLAALLAQLPADQQETHAVLPLLTRLSGLVDEFARAEHDRRIRIMTELKARFTDLTGQPPNRFHGRHYADRGLLHEECLSRIDDVAVGPWLRELVTDELAVVYDLLLTGPRHRLRRERALLADWFAERFGAGAETSLMAFYRCYFADRAELIRRCQAVEDELVAIDRALVGVLTAGVSMREAEAVVDRATVAEFIERHPRTPGAVCNPDLMLAAGNRADLLAGRFLAVVGDCHAMRELLTHTSLSPLIAERDPDLVSEILSLYAEILDEDEVLCDVMRTHLDKTGAQLRYPIPDVEFLGRSPMDRGSVIPAAELRVRHRGDRIELVTSGLDGRLRLLAPPATGPSITRDPLAVFSFPRHFGGLTIHGAEHPHLPRFRCGRVVFQRELWRVDCARLAAAGDAAGFLVAARLRDRLRLPRFVFAKHPGEPKPVFVDLESPLLVRQLIRLARGRTGTVLLSEMLPGPNELWLRAEGHRYTSEVRFAVFG